MNSSINKPFDKVIGVSDETVIYFCLNFAYKKCQIPMSKACLLETLTRFTDKNVNRIKFNGGMLAHLRRIHKKGLMK
jgi:hypothetical protein